MTLGLFGLILCSYVVRRSVEKPNWIVELSRSHEELCTHTLKKLIWIYGVEQPDPFEAIKGIWAPCQCEFILKT